jgi:transposase
MKFLTEEESMYRLSDLLENKDPENLFVDDITTEDLYGQRFGWTLDKIVDAEPRDVLKSVIATAVTTEDVDFDVFHVDTTSKSFMEGMNRTDSNMNSRSLRLQPR